MAGDIHGITNFSHLSLAGNLGVSSDLSLAAGAVSATSAGRLTMASGSSLVVASGATVTFQPGFQWSVATIAAASSLASLTGTGMQVGLFFAASGLSLVCRSGNSLYYFNSAASGAAP
jgi:hypothetical protein